MTPRRKISMQIPALLLAWAGMTGCTDHLNPSYAPYASLELPSKTPVDGRVTVRFFGVSTLLFDDGVNALMIDGFFSRPGPLQVAAGKIGPADDQIAYALQNAGNITRLDALFVAHSDYDHALDSARVARHTGAKLAGSHSTANLGHGEGLLPERICVFKSGETYTFGDFRVTPYQSPHSPDPPFEGHIDKPLSPPAHVSQYREGGNYSFLISHRDVAALVHPSTNYKDGALGNTSADVVFLGIGKLGQQDETFLKDYWRGVVKKTGAKVLVPIHWDDFTLPLSQGLKPMPRIADEFVVAMRRLQAMADRRGVGLWLMPLFKPVDLETVARIGSPDRRPTDKTSDSAVLQCGES